jgi:hypothetical protein
MEYEIELTPFQILLSLEMYSNINQILNFRIPHEEIQKIKDGVQIISFNKKKYLTKIAIDYVNERIKSSLLEQINYFFSENMLENQVKDTYNFIVEKSQNSSVLPLCEYLPFFLKEVSNTLLIDIYSNHFAGLIQYIIKMGLRKEYSKDESEILSNKLVNDLLATEPDLTLLTKYLDGQYWTSSRHLELVTNSWKPLNLQFKNCSSLDTRLVKWIMGKIPFEIQENFQNYLKHTLNLNTFKIIDAQIQIRAAFLCKNSVNDYLKKKEKTFDYIWNVEIIKDFLQEILEDCNESMQW